MSRRLSPSVARRAHLAWAIGVAGATAAGLALLVWALSTELTPAPAARCESRATRAPHGALEPVADNAASDTCEHAAPYGPDGAADEIAQRLARREWPAAAAVIAGFADPEDRLSAWPLLLGAWAEADPAAALQFLQTRLALLERSAALAAVVQGWAEHDPAAAAAWLGAQPSRAENDAAFAALARNSAVIETQPLLAVEWAANITDARLRWESLRTAIQLWAQRDESAARAYVARAPDLASAQRALLLQRTAQRTALLD